MKLEMNEIQSLIDTFVKSGLGEMEVETGGTRILLKKEGAGTQYVIAGGSGLQAAGIPGLQIAGVPGIQAPGVPGMPTTGIQGAQAADAAVAQNANLSGVQSAAFAEGQTANGSFATTGGTSAASQTSPSSNSNLTTIKAPIAGIFYRAPSPDEEPFVKEGDAVKKGDTIGLMEAMKLMNEIPAPCDGIVREIIAKDSEFCEFDKPIITIEAGNV